MASHDQSGILLVFEIADTYCAVSSEFVQEVQRAVSLSSVPEAGPNVLGAMNLRGQMVLVLDLRAAFGAPPKAVAPTDHFVVILYNERRLAIRVDRARELMQVEDSAIAHPDGVQPTAFLISQVARAGDRFLHIVDPARLVALANAAK